MDPDTGELFRQLLDLIAGECRRTGLLLPPSKPRLRRKPAPHGTDRRYELHRRDCEPPCAPCKAAHVLAVQKRPSYNRRRVRATKQELDVREIRNGLPGFRPYVYRGTGRDELTWWMDDAEAGAA